MRKLVFKKQVFQMLLELPKETYPEEVIVLLRGKESGEQLVVEEILLAPLSVYGEGFSSFRLDMMPIDFSIVGVAHSHPSGSKRPSIEDLNNMLGKVVVIVAAPYLDASCVAVYDGKGRRVPFEVTED